ncbi:hypothetical protein F8B43_1780 [Methylorubrum populi]|uniref:Uncharacterized protein n=1 Tax=Methylorubrum populi TaxID=223967 RepID=A0A833J8Q1_9HYPH|nr:hypothetical protein F8B43_1780 [Methylorubrum populi]
MRETLVLAMQRGWSVGEAYPSETDGALDPRTGLLGRHAPAHR